MDQDQDGKPVRVHYQEVERRGGFVLELHPDPPPHEISHLWDWFSALHVARSGGGFGPGPITYPDIFAWSALTRTQVSEWEIGVIKRLDVAYLNITHGNMAKKREQKPPGPPPKRSR